MPSRMPTAVARPVTKALCELGMPPEPTNRSYCLGGARVMRAREHAQQAGNVARVEFGSMFTPTSWFMSTSNYGPP